MYDWIMALEMVKIAIKELVNTIQSSMQDWIMAHEIVKITIIQLVKTKEPPFTIRSSPYIHALD